MYSGKREDFVIILITVSMGLEGSHGEYVITSWPVSWILAFRGSSPPPLSWECMFCPWSPQQELFSSSQSWDSNVLLNHMDWICDGTLLRVLWKLPRLWQLAVDFYLFFGHPRQTSSINSLAFESCHRLTWSDLPPALVSPYPLSMGASLQPTQCFSILECLHLKCK